MNSPALGRPWIHGHKREKGSKNSGRRSARKISALRACTKAMAQSPFDGLKIPRDLVCEFFAFFARFEFAPKEHGYGKAQGRYAAPDWQRFAAAASGWLIVEADSALADAIALLVGQPPQIQRWLGLNWEARVLPWGARHRARRPCGLSGAQQPVPRRQASAPLKSRPRRSACARCARASSELRRPGAERPSRDLRSALRAPFRTIRCHAGRMLASGPWRRKRSQIADEHLQGRDTHHGTARLFR